MHNELLSLEQYEELLTKYERRMFRLNEQHEKLRMFVIKILWPRASLTVADEAREQMAKELLMLGVDVFKYGR